ncbi:hypothetical protein CU098_006153, partial [Rhizopus stolonifer]
AIIPQKYKPVSDLMSKAMLENKEVMNLILTSIIGNHAKDLYMPRTCEWIDGNCADMVYGPILPPSNALPPIVVEVQNVVNDSFMHCLQKYCNHVYETFGNIKPIALTLCVKSIREVFTNDYYNTEKGEFFKQLP